MKRALPLLRLLVVALLPAMACAQTAKITGVVLDVTCRTSGTAGWTRARLGMQLLAGAQVRTGKRSTCQINFPDGSVVRLSPQSDLTISRVAGKDLSMGHGKLYARIVKGTTARIQGGTGVASIKGTELEFDAGDIRTPKERRDNVLRIFEGLAELSGASGKQMVGAGSESKIGTGGSPSPLSGVPSGGFAGMSGGQWWDGVGGGSNVQSTPASYSGIEQRMDTTDSGRPPWMGAPGQFPLQNGTVVVDIQSAMHTQSAMARSMNGQRVAALAMPPPEAMLEVPPMTLAQTGTEAFGKHFYGPDTRVDLFGLLSTDNSLAGARIRPTAVWGDFYLEVGATGWATSREPWQTKLTEGLIKARPTWGDVTVGRQHILAGPVNNSNLGSLIGFYTADAVRWQPHLGDVSLDLAYVYDFMPLGSETQHGFYGRAQTNVLKGTAGVNAVNFDGIGTGWSLDFSVPVVEGKWDLYGEFGQDPTGKDLQTVGSYFPDLYQQYDIDLFLEYAHREGQPCLTSLNAYRTFEHNWTGYLQLQATGDNQTILNIGAIKGFQ